MLLAVPATARAGRWVTRSCKGSSGTATFTVRMHLTRVRSDGRTWRVIDRMRYRMAHMRRTSDNAWYVIRKGPSIVKHGTNRIPSNVNPELAGGESPVGGWTDLTSDARYHSVDMNQLTMHPLPVGRYRWNQNRDYDVWYHYLFSFWPHGRAGSKGCYFYVDL
jgi:hypothetical protein